MSVRNVFGACAIIGVAVFAAITAIFIFDFCRYTINSIKCWSSEYGPLYYLAACEKAGFTDEYEGGAIYYGLESEISEAIRNAQVIFVGNSKLQQAFSTQETSAYFAQQNIRFYVLGFTARNLGVVLPMLKRKQASPSLLIVNADPFFYPQAGPDVMLGGLKNYWRFAKLFGLQRLQRVICPSYASF